MGSQSWSTRQLGCSCRHIQALLSLVSTIARSEYNTVPTLVASERSGAIVNNAVVVTWADGSREGCEDGEGEDDFELHVG
jgi:hypothetical protein